MPGNEGKYYRSLYEATKAISSSLEPAVVLSTIVEQTAKALDAKACSLRLLDRTGKHLLASGAWGLSKGYLRKGKVEVEKSGLDAQVLAGNTVYIANAKTDDRFQYKDAAKSEGLTSILVVPLQVESKVIGVMRIYTGEERSFSASESEFLTVMASVSAIAIENARMHQALKTDYELLTMFQYQTFED